MASVEKLDVELSDATSLQELNSSSAHLPFSQKLAQELLNTYGSPLYVYQGDILRQTIQHITQAFSYPRTQFRFASVTNGNISVLQIFRDQGWGLHANTPGDIYLGLQAGFAPEQIVYSGSNLNRAEMEQVLNWGVKTLNLDSVSQLQLCCEVYHSFCRERHIAQRGEPAHASGSVASESSTTPRLGLRLNLPEITGDSRIGVRLEEFPDAICALRSSEAIALTHQAGLKISGLHFYRGTGTNATEAFTNVIDKVITTAQLLPDWEYLDFGGGFGYPYHHDGAAFNWELFGTELSDRMSRLGREIELVIEPGRAAIAGCATLLAKVVSVKWQSEKQIVGVDTTVANLCVPSVHGGYREIVTWKEVAQMGRVETLHATSVQSKIENSKSKIYFTDVCGNTTYSRDFLGRNCQLPALEIGDIVGILDVGAYGYAMSSHFLHRPKPAEVLLENDTYRLIRRREDYSVLLANQVFY
ncbi:diaminopimelate decarboxylase family protein [Brasilonema bromeliae]|uniref:Decarboxylase n=1 Tax=Brasilonema bromeliae SPC951 TaxID=385972 RepID=A0ABX1PAI7_9CYAN|nr:decarboxylase [Brasilonema bromeliae]NMG21450.1 decarboxylase [Brasilonema bromeliae SPC951]